MQSKFHSFIESTTNVLIGLLISILAQLVIFPMFGFYPSISDQLQIAGLFTIVSIIRSYFVRRLFNYISARNNYE